MPDSTYQLLISNRSICQHQSIGCRTTAAAAAAALIANSWRVCRSNRAQPKRGIMICLHLTAAASVAHLTALPTHCSKGTDYHRGDEYYLLHRIKLGANVFCHCSLSKKTSWD